jgi:hypothetical protein
LVSADHEKVVTLTPGGFVVSCALMEVLTMFRSFALVSGLALVAALGSLGCSSSDDVAQVGDPANGTGAGAGAGGGGGENGLTNVCGLDTQFAGDENCILPPAENEGFQLHVGPPDYDNPDAVWVMEPGSEITECYVLNTPNTEPIYYFQNQYRMRPGSHHLIMSQADGTNTPGWGPCESSIVGAIGGTQHPIEDFPPDGKVAPEDEGLARQLAPNTQLSLQLHFFNATEKPTLREVWVNFLYKDPSTVTKNWGMLGGFAPVNVPPHTSVTTGGTCSYDQAIRQAGETDERIVSLFGHAHAHNQRFVVYKDKADGTSEVVYDMYDWSEAPTYVYNTLIQNPVADGATRTSGATSGILSLAPGEQLRYECDITNDLDITLTPSNEVFTGEMCNLFGSVVGPGFPCFSIGQ